MRSIEKTYRKQESPNLPFSIKLVWGVKLIATAAGFYLWGIDFAWVVVGLYFGWNTLKGIISCLLNFIALVGFFYFLFTHIL